MKHITKHMKSGAGESLSNYSTMLSVRESCKNVARLIFSSFSAFYTSWTFDKLRKEEQIVCKKAWLHILSQMREDDVRAALDYILSKKNTLYPTYAPNPLEFSQLPVQLKAQEIPSMDECYKAAIRGDWDFHPLVRPCAIACDIYWLRQSSDYAGRKRFSGYYASHKEKLFRGEALSRPERMIERKKEGPIPATSPRAEINRRVSWFEKTPEYQSFCEADGLLAKQEIYNKAIGRYKDLCCK